MYAHSAKFLRRVSKIILKNSFLFSKRYLYKKIDFKIYRGWYTDEIEHLNRFFPFLSLIASQDESVHISVY